MVYLTLSYRKVLSKSLPINEDDITVVVEPLVDEHLKDGRKDGRKEGVDE